MEKTALEQIMFEAYKASRLIEFVMEKLRESGTMLFDPEEVSHWYVEAEKFVEKVENIVKKELGQDQGEINN